MTIGDRIKLLRKQRKMSMEDVAFGINVGRATICRYENGQITNIPPDKIEQIATLFSVSPAYLMGWEEHEIEDDTPKTKEAKILSKGVVSVMAARVQIPASPLKSLVNQRSQGFSFFIFSVPLWSIIARYYSFYYT